MEQKKPHFLEKILPGLLAGLTNAFSMIVSNPLDVLKIRFQTSGEGQISQLRTISTFQKAKTIFVREGIQGLYKGLTISMIRETTFSSLRVGLYEPCKNIISPSTGENTSGLVKVFAGLLSGAISAAIFNPTDVIKVRFQGDNSAKNEPRRYPSVRSAFKQILREEGLRNGLYKGVFTTTIRSAVLSCTQLASYDIFKHNILFKHFGHIFTKDSFTVHCLSSIFAGVMTTITSSPFDVARTRLMNEKLAYEMKRGESFQLKYSTNPFITIMKIMREEGIRALYKGFVPAYIRLGTVTIMFFVLYEKLREICGIKGL